MGRTGQKVKCHRERTFHSQSGQSVTFADKVCNLANPGANGTARDILHNSTHTTHMVHLPHGAQTSHKPGKTQSGCSRTESTKCTFRAIRTVRVQPSQGLRK